MSNNREGADGDSNICRDFLRNVCSRGANCKYKHPDHGTKQRDGEEFQFCHDYQNSECKRSNCKFIHCSRPEQDYYKETGKLPPALEETLDQGLFGGSGGADGDIPVCRDYLKGECNRGSGCKFRHLSRGDMEFEERARRRPPPPFRYGGGGGGGGHYSEYESDRMRRPRYDAYEPYGERPSAARPVEMRELEDENVMLRRKIDDLRKQVSDLTATNEVLLDQNARLRANKDQMSM